MCHTSLFLFQKSLFSAGDKSAGVPRRARQLNKCTGSGVKVAETVAGEATRREKEMKAEWPRGPLPQQRREDLSGTAHPAQSPLPTSLLPPPFPLPAHARAHPSSILPPPPSSAPPTTPPLPRPIPARRSGSGARVCLSLAGCLALAAALCCLC
jgi:hypothetical protein